ncbi:polysaccharide deacetylase family protein [Lacinutrix jangbogonensis]|uniref:polysaccharide deacetylase family protein n=1 Tax=Lacinutrix jangbogonensis TaxID=1469557 RepID=UPI00053E490B|nr:polysaccharide deacetylase family protein [Lacinutrix jangbogonensis]
MKNIIFIVMYFLGFSWLIRVLFQKKKTTILLLHELPLNNAERIIAFLNKKYSVITLETFIQAKINNKLNTLPNYPLVITFDDGRKSNMELINLFNKYENKPTIYVCSDKSELDGYYLFNDFDFETANRVYDLQGHTISHPNLLEIDEDKAIIEIGKSKTVLEKKLNKKLTSFAYPYGKYGERDVKIVEQLEYTNAVTVDFGFNDSNTDIFKLKRICLTDTPNLYEAAVKVSGLWGMFKKIRNG